MKSSDIENVALYYRYSSEKDAQVENSEKRQKEMLKGFCINKKWIVEWSGGDKATSGDKDKPALMELRKLIEDKQILVDAIVVSSWDRITRRHILNFHEDVKWIADAGILLVLQQENRIFDLNNPEDQITLGIKVYEASRYLKSLSNNVRSGMEVKFRNRTLGYGRPPFGYDKVDGKLVPNEDLPLVQEIFETFSTNSVVACVPVMRKARRYQETGKAPSTTAVKTVLRNTIYIGYRTFGVAGTGRHGTIRGEVTSGSRNVNRIEESALPLWDVRDEVPPVIDEEIFNEVQKRLDSNKKARPKRKTAKYRYSGLVRCSCGCKLVADKRKKHINYVCPKSKNLKAGCDVDVVGRKTMRGEEIESIVDTMSKTILRDNTFHLNVLEGMVDYVLGRMVSEETGNREAAREIVRLEARKERMWEMVKTCGDEQFEAAQNAIQELTNEIEVLRNSLSVNTVGISDLLDNKFEECEWDITGTYLNKMMVLAKECAETKNPKTSKPIGKAGQAQRYGRKVMTAVNKIVTEVIKGREFTPLLSLMDELQVSWKKVDDRCRPHRIICRWRVNEVESKLEVDETAYTKVNTGRRKAIIGGVIGTLVVQIVLYPTRNKIFARLVRE